MEVQPVGVPPSSVEGSLGLSSDLPDAGGGDSAQQGAGGDDDASCPSQSDAAVISIPSKRKFVRWSKAMDHGMLVIVNCLGPAKQVGHGHKTPFFTTVAERAKATPAFDSVKYILTFKQCVDRFKKLVHDHRVTQKELAGRSGTDDEVVDDMIVLLDDICSVIDDAEDSLAGEQDRKRKADKELIEAGENMRNQAMRRSAKKKRKTNKAGKASSPSGASSGEEKSDIDSDDSPSNERNERPSPSGGPAAVIRNSRGPRQRSEGIPGGNTEEMIFLESVQEREGLKLSIDRERLELERENIKRLARVEEQRLEIEQRKVSHEAKDLELRESKQHMKLKEREERLKLDRLRMEYEKNEREAERVSKEAAAMRQDKLLEAVLSLVTKKD